MTDFDIIESMNNGKDKTEKLFEYYTQEVKVDLWLTNTSINSIINFKDRVEFKKNNIYHRLNGPAIDHNDTKLDKYYYNGEYFEDKAKWNKAIIKEVRRIKIAKLNKIKNPE